MGEIAGEVDLTTVLLYTFWAFFFYLVYYLQKESRREGYPLEADETGKVERPSVIFMPDKKTYLMPHGHPDVVKPDDKRETRELKLKPLRVWGGAPKEPTGSNPMLDGVGPGSYAERADVPDLTAEGEPKIVPLRTAPGFKIAGKDVNPVGLRVMGCDGEVGGVITDVWVDKAERMIRFYEVQPITEGDESAAPAPAPAPVVTSESGASDDEAPAAAPSAAETPSAPRVLVPANFIVLKRWRHFRRMYVHAITSAQFADVPKTKSPDQVTLLEEDKIFGYFGGGLMYATPERRRVKFSLMKY